MSRKLRLGVNIDHVATLRNARGGTHPCPIRAALEAKEAGADGITAHLREDWRHIRDRDIERPKAEVALPLNMEMAATDEMLAIALKLKPNAACIVPEKRAEITTEGGLNVKAHEQALIPFVARLRDAGIRVSLFIDPDVEQIEAAMRTHADIVELHTGAYAEGKQDKSVLGNAARLAHGRGLEVHAGHGLTFDNIAPIAAIPEVVELNIGHFLIGEAVFIGLGAAVCEMQRRMKKART